MSRRSFHIQRDAESVTVTRYLPARFDIVVETRFPPLRKGCLAQQIRQDLWRRLRAVRGFSPVVEVRDAGGELHVRAGGRMDCNFPRGLTPAIEEFLAQPDLRQRWIAHATLGGAPKTRTVARALRRREAVD